MKKLNLFGVLLLILAAGCKPGSVKPDNVTPTVKAYQAHGVVRAITPDRHTVTIQHDAIPGFMSPMTMDFTVKNTNELDSIATNDEITFQLVVGEDDSWIKNIRFVSHHIGSVPGGVVTIHESRPELTTGDAFPDYEFKSEDGSLHHFSEFRGRVLAFTFFFVRCPLPDYCPRMSKDFAETRQLLLNAPGAPTNWQFLSISFDPEFDQPVVLSSYANSFREGNPDRWLFAVVATNTLAEIAPKLDLMVRHEGDGISHNLRTVVLNPQGRIFRQFNGNEWIPQKLADAMLEAASH